MHPQALLHQGGEGKGCLRHAFDQEHRSRNCMVHSQQAKRQAFYLKLLAHGICHETAKQQVRECFELARSEAKQVQISARRIRKRQSRENPQGSGWRALRRRKKESRKR